MQHHQRRHPVPGLDYRESFAEPLIEALRQRVQQARDGRYRNGSGGGGDSDSIQHIAVYDLRGQLMWTYKVLSAPDADVALSQVQTNVLLDVSEYVREHGNTLTNPDWPPTINAEMDELQHWLKTVQSWD